MTQIVSDFRVFMIAIMIGPQLKLESCPRTNPLLQCLKATVRARLTDRHTYLIRRTQL
jgi:hypothetical protein